MIYKNNLVINSLAGILFLNLNNYKVQKYKSKDMKQFLACIQSGREELLEADQIKFLDHLQKDGNSTKLKQIPSEFKINFTIVVSYNCNMNCKYCYEKDRKYQKNIITREYVDNIEEFYHKIAKDYDLKQMIGEIHITGGEPLLKENREILQYILEKWNSKYVIATNGINLSEFLGMFAGKDIVLRVSLDGIESFNTKRRSAKEDNNYYSKILSGIREALELRIPVYISAVFDDKEIETYPQFFDILEELGWLKDPFLNFGFNALVENDLDSVQSDKYLEHIIDRFLLLKKMDKRTKYIDPSGFIQGISEIVKILKYQSIGLPVYRDVYSCNSMDHFNYVFDANGNVYICALSCSKEFEIGQYYPDIQYNKTKIEENLKRNVMNMEKCRTCTYKYLCRGGCPAMAIVKNGGIFAPDCGIFQNEKIIDRIGDIIF